MTREEAVLAWELHNMSKHFLKEKNICEEWTLLMQ